jgi:hypothetical protein
MNESNQTVIVIGSGASGAAASSYLVNKGIKVLMLDVGMDDTEYRDHIPDIPFSRIRRECEGQQNFFLGKNLEGVPKAGVKVGAQLTPPRQFISKKSDEYQPWNSKNFSLLQSLAKGGLAAGWGAASFTFDDLELKKAGIFEENFARYYNEAVAEIGVSADSKDDNFSFALKGISTHQPALEIDSNAEKILSAYNRRRDVLNTKGLFLGKTPLAVLSQDLGERRANPYFDMDFWSDSRKSVFRPRYLIDKLALNPLFTYKCGILALSFEERGGSVLVHSKDLKNNQQLSFYGSKLMLCAGPINSARIALKSLELVGYSTSLLSSPYTYIASANLAMLGRSARDRRHSLSQLCGIFRPQDDPNDFLNLQFYSYRSLLLFKLVKEMPLPVWAGLAVSRILMNSLTVIGVFHSDSPSSKKYLRLTPSLTDGPLTLDVHYEREPSQSDCIRAREREVKKILVQLGCIPFMSFNPGEGSGIHYGGTIPCGNDPFRKFGTDMQGRLLGTKEVFVGDNATWNYLPAKGPTLTLMANAKRIAQKVVESFEK